MLAAFILIGIVLIVSLAALHLSIENRIRMNKLRKKQFNDIALNPRHPAIAEYKKLMIDDMGMDELVVEQELDRIKTIPSLKIINKTIKKELKDFDKKNVKL